MKNLAKGTEPFDTKRSIQNASEKRGVEKNLHLNLKGENINGVTKLNALV